MTTNQPPSTWILVAQRAGAWIFSSRGPGSTLERINVLENPRGRLQASEIDSDRSGRAGHGTRSLPRDESATEHVEQEFVKHLSDTLDRERNAGVFDQLIIIAGPRFLGKLRDALSEPTRRLIKVELNKELIDPSVDTLRKQLDGLARV